MLSSTGQGWKGPPLSGWILGLAQDPYGALRGRGGQALSPLASLLRGEVPYEPQASSLHG
jgi:hypothetical protein